MAANNRKPFWDRILEAINAGGERLEKEAEQFGYSFAKEHAENQQEIDPASTDKEGRI